MVGQLELRQHATTAVQQLREQPELQRRQLDGYPIPRHLHLPGIEHIVAEMDARRGQPVGAADDGADPGQHLLDAAGLDHIVVSAGLDGLDFFFPAAARRQHQDGRVAIGVAPALQDGEPIEGRQAEIEDHRLEFLGVAAIPGDLAIGFDLDHEAGAAQRHAQGRSDASVIFGDENAHQSSTSLPERAS